MKQPLYKLTDQYKSIEGMVENEFLTREELDQTLASIKDQIEDKVENIAKIVLDAKSSIEVIKLEEKRLYDRRKAIINTVEWLKNYLLTEMVSANIYKIKKEVITISVQNNPPSVEVIEPEAIPKEYRVIIPEHWEPDKTRIIEHFKETGEIVSGTDVILNKKHVSIR